MSHEWKLGDKATVFMPELGETHGKTVTLRDAGFSGSPCSPWWNTDEAGWLPQHRLRMPIPTLEENQARLRQEQADICKRLGLSIGPKQSIEIAMSWKTPTVEEVEELRRVLGRMEAKILYAKDGVTLKPSAQHDRDSIANLARTAIRELMYLTGEPWELVSRMEQAIKAVELILAECTKP
jgi:hypothetical protein